MLKQNPPDAKAEAVIGIAGPIAGTLGALCCYAAFLYTGNPLLGKLAQYSMWMNLFNLIPITRNWLEPHISQIDMGMKS